MDEVIERVARAIIGSSRYDNLPERATYLQRKSDSFAEWHDRAEARETARDAIEEYWKAMGEEPPIAPYG